MARTTTIAYGVIAAVVFLAIGATIAGLLVTSDMEPGSDHITEVPVRLQDGTQITCLVYRVDDAGGLDCNWNNE